jgi:cytochrome c
MKTTKSLFVASSVLFALTAMSPVYAAPDAAQAEALLKGNKCTKCHDAVKDKSGPSFKKVAAKLKGKADAEATVTKFLTTGPKVKAEDGSEEEHKVIKVKNDAELKNLVQWVLSQ